MIYHMYFLKLENIKKHNQMNEYLVKRFDTWLASQSEMYTEYLNPLSFVSDTRTNKKLGLLVFAIASSGKLLDGNPLLRVKYLVDCPQCLSNYGAYYQNSEIPASFVECDEEECSTFIPKNHPERITIYFELLERPIILEDDVLDIYNKSNNQSLTAADEDVENMILVLEESKGYE